MATSAGIRPVTSTRATESRTREGDVLLLSGLSLLALTIHFLTNSRYGYHGDELYFMACGDHLAWGYVDQPPLIPFLARVSRMLMGDSLFSIRFFPALAHAGLVFLTGWIAGTLGGSRFAQALAALSVLLAPVFLFSGNVLTPGFEPMWTVCAFLLILILRDHEPSLWLWLGVAAGIGLMNKHSMLFWGLGLAVGLLLTARKEFLNRWIWLGAGVALLIVLPNLLWEQQHHWVTLQALRESRDFNRLPFSLSNFWFTQVVMNGFLALPIWLAGLVYFLFSRQGKAYRAIGVAFLVVVVVLTAENGKAYYLSGAFPVILAGGAVGWSELVDRWRRAWVKPALLTVFVISGAMWLPMALPVLSPAGLIRYQDLLRFHGTKFEKSDVGQEIPTYFGNMIGWPDLVQAVAQAYRSIPAAERSRTAILTNTYGQAGAIDLLGAKLGLPKAISGHENYSLWGPRDYTGEKIIAVGFSKEDAEPDCASVDVAAEVNVPFAPPWVNGPILICSHLKMTLQEAWPTLQRFH
ncbi:MAG TPA: glycosyltransferase family 39 protein [Terriglobales bacterium]|nr:glycosyltransferase family 39 protein [Terriglobales bacterium]